MALVAHELAHVVQDVGDLDRHLREVTVLEPHRGHFHELVERHVDLVAMGNDTILGGSGNDLIVGDAFVVLAADLTLVPGGSPWHSGRSDDWLDRDWNDRKGHGGWDWHHHHGHDEAPALIETGSDVIAGGDGNDLVFGDSLARVSSTVTRGAGLGWHEFHKARDDAGDALEAIVALEGWRHGERAACDSGDDISGGAGDDILFGQAGNDALRGDAGNDRLVGGDGKDKLDGGPGWDHATSGNESSRALREAVAARMIDWEDSFRGYGLGCAPFGGLTPAKGGGQHNLSNFEFLSYDRPGHGRGDD
jgi:Ca2+-binding RTX toxin-like protein